MDRFLLIAFFVPVGHMLLSARVDELLCSFQSVLVLKSCNRTVAFASENTKAIQQLVNYTSYKVKKIIKITVPRLIKQGAGSLRRT